MKRWKDALGFSLILTTTAAPSFADTIEEKAMVCAACHGEKGVPQDKSIPIIWGQNEGYIYIELRDIKKGARKNDQMAPVVENMEREDMLALAAYFASKPWPKTEAPTASKADEAAAMTAIKSVVCSSCHLEQFQGDSSVPRLAGQNHDYLAKTMTEFRDRTRANNPGMSDLMNTVTPEQVTAIAAYLAGL